MYFHILLCDLTRAWWLCGVRFVVRMLVVGGRENVRGIGVGGVCDGLGARG